MVLAAAAMSSKQLETAQLRAVFFVLCSFCFLRATEENVLLQTGAME